MLYSRYPAQQGLLSVNYYRTLLRQAIMLRNQIVATELLIAREGFGRILPLLTPDIIYKEVKTDGYFAQYVKPQLLQLTAPLSQLTPLERAYYERMMTFISREQVAHKLGNAESRLYHSGGAASDLWLMPLAEKLDTGNIILNLTLRHIDCSQPQSGYDVMTLQAQDAQPTDTPSPINFRLGENMDLDRNFRRRQILQRIDSLNLLVKSYVPECIYGSPEMMSGRAGRIREESDIERWERQLEEAKKELLEFDISGLPVRRAEGRAADVLYGSPDLGRRVKK